MPSILGIGADIVKRARIESAIKRWGRRFTDRIFTPREQTYCFKFRDPSLHLAGRFAVKEALFKALGTGWSRGVAWKEIETTNAPSGRPQVAVTGRVKALLKEQGGGEIFVTISHDTDYSIGQVMITRSSSRRATPSPRPLPRRGGEGKKKARR
ncbi:MAG: holo-ACP synthase [Nitrospirae bacterium]|nr:holo-ACP synthase [Nitrospirota bacterium]